jgi:hypothetical protein
MQTKQQGHQHAAQDKDDHPQRQSGIRNEVMRALGQPIGLYRVQVQRLWEDHYRVNVLVGEDAVSARIAHSYFLVLDSAGKIIASTPNLERRYQAAAERAANSSPPA